MATRLSALGERTVSTQAAINGSNECQSPRLSSEMSPSVLGDRQTLHLKSGLHCKRKRQQILLTKVFDRLSAKVEVTMPQLPSVPTRFFFKGQMVHLLLLLVLLVAAVMLVDFKRLGVLGVGTHI